jgi:hypothetical protein
VVGPKVNWKAVKVPEGSDAAWLKLAEPANSEGSKARVAGEQLKPTSRASPGYSECAIPNEGLEEATRRCRVVPARMPLSLLPPYCGLPYPQGGGHGRRVRNPVRAG